MGMVRNFGVGMAAIAVLAAATGCSVTEKSSSSSSSTTSSKPSSTSATSSSSATSTTSSAPTSGVAPLGDYTYLLLQASDVGSDPTGAPMQNPGGVAGAAVTFANPDRSRTIDDLVVVFTDPSVAAQQAKDHASSFGKYVTGAPQPFDVGTNGLIGVGTSPDNSKAVTYVTYAEGKVVVDLEFDSALNDPAPQDVVLQIARKQDETVKSKMPS